MSHPDSSQSSSIKEVFDDCWTYAAGDAVPGWLEHTEGVAQLTFTVGVTIHMALDGGYWVVPHEPTEFVIHAVGYGENTPVKIHGQGRGGVRVLTRAPVDVMAYLALPQ